MMSFLVLQCLMSLLMLVSSDVYVLINYTSFVESLFIAISVAGLLYLRKSQPNLYRPITVCITFLHSSNLLKRRVQCLIFNLVVNSNVDHVSVH